MYYNANILLLKYSITIQRQKKTHTYVYDKRVKCTKKNYELNLKSKNNKYIILIIIMIIA